MTQKREKTGGATGRRISQRAPRLSTEKNTLPSFPAKRQNGATFYANYSRRTSGRKERRSWGHHRGRMVVLCGAQGEDIGGKKEKTVTPIFDGFLWISQEASLNNRGEHSSNVV